jgi:hypothetical protein
MKLIDIFANPRELNPDDPYDGFSENFKQSLIEIKKEKLVYEGLIVTYQIGSVITMIQQKWNFVKVRRGQTGFGFESNDFKIFIDISNINQIDFDDLLRILNTSGWFIAKIIGYFNKQIISNYDKDTIDEKSITKFIEETNSINMIEFSIEAKFDLEADKKFWPEYLYHVTHEKIIGKIKKKGLIPKSQNKMAIHPERIYLVANKDFAEKQLYYELRNKSNYKSENWFILTIRTSEFQRFTRLFKDQNCEYACYTLSNIPPRAITNIEPL